MVASYGGQILIEGCCIEGNGGPCQCGTVVLLCNPPSSFQQLGGFRWDRIEHLSRLFCCTDLFSLQNVLTRACLYGRGAGARTFLYAEIRGPYQDKSDRVGVMKPEGITEQDAIAMRTSMYYLFKVHSYRTNWTRATVPY